MHHPLLLLVPVILAATRSLAAGIQSPNKPEARPMISAETEREFLLVTIFCLTGLLISLYVLTEFPDLGAAIVEMNQF